MHTENRAYNIVGQIFIYFLFLFFYINDNILAENNKKVLCLVDKSPPLFM